MSYTCCSRNFSSRSLGDHLRYPGASCGPASPSNLVYSADLCPRSSCQLGSSLYSQETCCEPIRTQTFRVVSRPCQTSCCRPRTPTFSSPCQASCCRPRTPTFSSPCQTTLPGSLGFRSSSCSSLSSGYRSCYSGVCGSHGFRRLGSGICGFPSLGCGSGFCPPTFASRSCHSSCYRPTCGSVFY